MHNGSNILIKRVACQVKLAFTFKRDIAQQLLRQEHPCTLLLLSIQLN